MLENRLPDATTVHWHGIPVPNAMDGVPGVTQDPVAPGETFVYEYVAEPAGTYIYHSHVALQLDRGLLGPLVIEERSPRHAHDRDHTIVLDDLLMGEPQLVEGGRRPMMMGMGAPGPEYAAFLINGRHAGDPAVLEVRRCERVRLRLINPASQTTFRVATLNAIACRASVDRAEVDDRDGPRVVVYRIRSGHCTSPAGPRALDCVLGTLARDLLMKAAVMERYGTPDVLELRQVVKPTPKADEVLVRVRAASVNDWDWGLLRGRPFVNRMLNGPFKPKVRIIGCDIAGHVEAVGGKVEGFQPGDEVYGDLSMSGFGAFAEYACAPEAALAHKPASMSFEQAAALPQAGMLAVQGLIDVGQLRPGQRLLLNGAGGGVGTIGLQIAKLRGAEVTVIDKHTKLDMLRAMGADHAIDYLEEDFTRSSKSYDLILDVKTNRSPFAYARVLNPNGIYATVGGDTSRLIQALVLGPLIHRLYDKRVRIVVLKANKDLAYLNELFEAGKLVPVIDGPFELADVPEALRLFGRGDHKGKIIVTMA